MIAVTGMWPFHAPSRLYSNSSGASSRLMFSVGKPVRAAQAAISARIADPYRRRRLADGFQHLHADQRILAAADGHQRAPRQIQARHSGEGRIACAVRELVIRRDEAKCDASAQIQLLR